MKNIHVFPSRIPGKLGYIGESNQYHLFSNGENPHDLFDNLATYKDMYITSENPIEVDDWCLSLSKDAAYGEVYRCWNVALINEEDRKIVLTTNKNLIQEGVQEIGLTFLQWFISNSKCESVGLVTQYKTSGGEWISYDKDFWEEGGNKPNYITTRFLPIILKDSSNLILDELAEQYALEKQNVDTSKYYIALEAFKKGFEAHQKRSYTYEEMKESFSRGHDSARLKGSYKSNDSFEEDWEIWSNQFKKEQS